MIRGFFLRLTPLYLLLIIPWPGLPETYAAGFRTVSEFAFGVPGLFGSGSLVRFRPLPPEAPELDQGYDTDIVLKNILRNSHKELLYKSRHAYLPPAIFIALMLASPLPMPRRLRRLAWGLLWIHGFVAVKLTVALMTQFASPPLETLDLTGWVGDGVVLGKRILIDASFPSFVAPIVLWTLLAWRREDWARILASVEADRQAS